MFFLYTDRCNFKQEIDLELKHEQKKLYLLRCSGEMPSKMKAMFAQMSA